MKGVFYNEMYSLELDKARWYQQFLRYENALYAVFVLNWCEFCNYKM